MERLEQMVLAEHVILEGRFAKSKDPISFQQRLDLDYQVIQEGDEWGQTWDSAWFHYNAHRWPVWSPTTEAQHTVEPI